MPPGHFETAAPASRPSPVMNLRDGGPDATVSTMTDHWQGLLAQQAVRAGISLVTESFPERARAEVDSILEERQTWEWTYGRSPAFRWYPPQEGANEAESYLKVREGQIEEVLGPGWPPGAQALSGEPFALSSCLGLWNQGRRI